MASKRGQLTLFVLLAVVLLSAILIFFLFDRPIQTADLAGGPKFEACIRDAIEQGSLDLSNRAGIANPEFTYPYQGEDYTYLCYAQDYYELCSVQQPFLKQTFEESLALFVKEQFTTCYQNSLEDLRSEGYGVTSGILSYDIFLEPGIMKVDINAPTTIGSQVFKNFNFRFDSGLYDTVMISTALLQSEAKYGDADTLELHLFYPDYRIEKIKRSDGTTLYKVKNKIYNYEFRFASRSLAWPAGYVI